MGAVSCIFSLIVSSRMTSTEASLPGDHEMSSISVQPTTNDFPIVDHSISDQENANEQLLIEIDEIYSPVLKLMKMFGAYFGGTNLKRLVHASGGYKKWVYLQGIYCGAVISGLWLNFVMAFVDVFLANNIYLFLMFSSWNLLIALSGTICLIVLCLPLADTRKSRFQAFLGNLIAVNSNVNLEKVKSKSRKGIIVFCFFFVSATVGVMITNLLLDINFAAFEPWNQWFGLRILSCIFSVYGMGAWLLPILFFCITCLILEELFDDLHKQMSLQSVPAVNIKTFMMEHRKLCEIVELADKVLSPLLLEMVSLYIPLLCFNFYKAVNLPEEDKYEFFGNNLIWFIAAASFLAIILLLGSKVCEKVRFMEIYLFRNYHNDFIVCYQY